MINKRDMLFALIAAFMFVFGSCTDPKKDLPVAASGTVKIHDAGWNDTSAANFHGKILKTKEYNLNNCVACHAKSFNGGTSGVSCSKCHQSYPHKSGWKTDSSSTNFHGKFILSGQGRVDSCGVCHGLDFKGGTSGKSCYQCHTTYPHEAGWQIDTSSVNFHGKYLLVNLGRTDSCGVCHGSDFKGGTSGVSCYNCHAPYPHKAGWTNVSSPDYHGQYLKANSWQVNECSPCHGAQFTGGSSGISCRDCHTAFPHPNGFGGTDGHPVYMRSNNFPLDDCKLCHGTLYDGGNVVNVSCQDCHTNPGGPEACNTCHGDFSGTGALSAAPPKSVGRDTSTAIRGVGAHQNHIATNRAGKQVKCQECHTIPAVMGAPGHIDIPFNVQVAFNDTLASLKTSGGTIMPIPVFNSTNISCSNVYCHGYFKNGNLTNGPIWNKVDGTQAACGTCHGDPLTNNPLPGGTHYQGTAFYSCQTCHTTGTSPAVPIATYDSGTNSWTITDRSRHINGKLSTFGIESSF